MSSLKLGSLIVPLAFAITGCTTISVDKYVEETSGNFPHIGTISTAPVGEVMFSQFRYWRKTGYALQDSATIPIGGGNVQVNAGDFLVRATVEGKTAYCTEKPAFKMLVGGKSACFVDRNSNGLFDTVKVASDVLWYSADLNSPLKYSQTEVIVPRADAKKMELVYQGLSKDVLRLTYREYFNDMARPAFFQDVTYDVAALPTDITFKSVRLHIIRAGNGGIEYQALSGF